MPRPRTGGVFEKKTKRRGSVFYARVRDSYGRRRALQLGSEREGWTRQAAEEERDRIVREIASGVWRDPSTLDHEDDVRSAGGLMPIIEAAQAALRMTVEQLIDAEDHPQADADALAAIREEVYDVEDHLALARARMHPLYEGQPTTKRRAA